MTELEHLMSDYKNSHYLLFGEDDSGIYGTLNTEATASYLHKLGFSQNALREARSNKNKYLQYEGYHDVDTHFCDYCGCALSGAEFEVLKDGRERCPQCSETVVKHMSDFETLFSQVRDGLCLKYGIDLPTPIKVKVVSQRKMSRCQGQDFVPTKYFDARAIGLAIKKPNGKFEMMFENGSPKGALTATAAHELTHIWQYSHWDWDAMERRYGDEFLAICEGMAKWSELQYMYLLNETAYADRMLENEVQRDDVYGYGLRLFLNHFPMTRGIVLNGPTPFTDPANPLGSD